jgi:hypothetical protein
MLLVAKWYNRLTKLSLLTKKPITTVTAKTRLQMMSQMFGSLFLSNFENHFLSFQYAFVKNFGVLVLIFIQNVFQTI